MRHVYQAKQQQQQQDGEELSTTLYRIILRLQVVGAEALVNTVPFDRNDTRWHFFRSDNPTLILHTNH